LNGREPRAVQESVSNAAAHYQRTRDVGFLFTTDAVSTPGFVAIERLPEGGRVVRLIVDDRARDGPARSGEPRAIADTSRTGAGLSHRPPPPPEGCMSKRKTADELREEGRAAERADVLAWTDRIAAATARVAERGDEGSRMAGHRMAALRDGFSAGVHVGEAERG
jgi:hypothetical protein